MKKLPCVDCITLSICKSKANEFRIAFPSINTLLNRCELMEEYLKKNIWCLKEDTPERNRKLDDFFKHFYELFQTNKSSER